jgi:hypothetical protein
MRFSMNNLRAFLATGALMEPISPIYADIISITRHTACSPVASIDIAKPMISRPEVAPIPVARAEIAGVQVAGKERAEDDISKQQTDARLPQASGRKSRTRAHQPLQLAARLQLVETPERGDHLLARLVAVAAALNDLQIGAPGRGLAAEVHGGGSACWCAHGVADSIEKNQIKPPKNVALHFRENATSHQAKSMTYATSTRANCRRFVKVTHNRRDVTLPFNQFRHASRANRLQAFPATNRARHRSLLHPQRGTPDCRQRRSLSELTERNRHTLRMK